MKEMLRRIGADWLKDVYYPVSICIWFNQSGNIIKVKQFDTFYCVPTFLCNEAAAASWLISNHHTGNMCPYDEDICNWKRAAESCIYGKCRLFLFNEDKGIEEVKEPGSLFGGVKTADSLEIKTEIVRHTQP